MRVPRQCIRELEALEALPWHKRLGTANVCLLKVTPEQSNLSNPRRLQLYDDLQQHPEQLQNAVAALDSTDGRNLNERVRSRVFFGGKLAICK